VELDLFEFGSKTFPTGPILGSAGGDTFLSFFAFKAAANPPLG
jgi:hypothetical protein